MLIVLLLLLGLVLAAEVTCTHLCHYPCSPPSAPSDHNCFFFCAVLQCFPHSFIRSLCDMFTQKIFVFLYFCFHRYSSFPPHFALSLRHSATNGIYTGHVGEVNGVVCRDDVKCLSMYKLGGRTHRIPPNFCFLSFIFFFSFFFLLL
ncbi:hypothetical protein, unlikely [Trypanosoma congolense IL3000]|uniref:Uncharacterized protein n=1 Tax=Trypanosoma congolense (strain IL3000) TaxID=1068625 RepID=F9W5X8_TRYCI|nr:hypothetical protein, unlikely [Trypanosoma congolense IL3000]